MNKKHNGTFLAAALDEGGMFCGAGRVLGQSSAEGSKPVPRVSTSFVEVKAVRSTNKSVADERVDSITAVAQTANSVHQASSSTR